MVCAARLFLVAMAAGALFGSIRQVMPDRLLADRNLYGSCNLSRAAELDPEGRVRHNPMGLARWREGAPAGSQTMAGGATRHRGAGADGMSRAERRAAQLAERKAAKKNARRTRAGGR